MLKKITVDQLKLGMHIQEFCGSWMDHPFWRENFILRDPADLKAIQTCGIREVWIDARKGLDVTGPTKQETEVQVEAVLQTIPAPQEPPPRVALAAEMERAAKICARSRQLGLDEKLTREAGMAGLLHDLGKALMPIEVLNKPGKLTDDEFRIMKSHPVEGHRMLVEGGTATALTLDVCLHHHEKIDGKGYPGGLKNAEISQFAKMGAVCDVYDAITSNRPYKSGWDPAESVRKMAEWAGHFDPQIFQAFVKSIGIYPIGSLVRLASGRLGIVVDQTDQSLLTPKVRVFFSVRSNTHIPPEVVDLSSRANSDKIVSREDPAKWNFPDLDKMWGSVDLF